MVACVSSHTAVLAAGEGKKRERKREPFGAEWRGERERKGAAWPEERKKPELLLLLLVVCV